jgi:hypothetical protein
MRGGKGWVGLSETSSTLLPPLLRPSCGITVGFMSGMILRVGRRSLPAFAGMRMLWSTKRVSVKLSQKV